MKEINHNIYKKGVTGIQHALTCLERKPKKIFSFNNPIKNTTMPPITMCEGKEGHILCPLRELCYRYKAKPDPNCQAYFVNLPFNIENERCESFKPLERFNKPKPVHWLFAD